MSEDQRENHGLSPDVVSDAVVHGLDDASGGSATGGAGGILHKGTDGPEIIADPAVRDRLIVYKQKFLLWLAGICLVTYAGKEIYESLYAHVDKPVPTWVLFLVAGAFGGSFDGIGIPSLTSLREFLISFLEARARIERR